MKKETETFVGQGLVTKTYEDCLANGYNPNGNEQGELRIDASKASIAAHVRASQAWALQSLKVGKVK